MIALSAPFLPFRDSAHLCFTGLMRGRLIATRVLFELLWLTSLRDDPGAGLLSREGGSASPPRRGRRQRGVGEPQRSPPSRNKRPVASIRTESLQRKRRHRWGGGGGGGEVGGRPSLARQRASGARSVQCACTTAADAREG